MFPRTFGRTFPLRCAEYFLCAFTLFLLCYFHNPTHSSKTIKAVARQIYDLDYYNGRVKELLDEKKGSGGIRLEYKGGIGVSGDDRGDGEYILAGEARLVCLDVAIVALESKITIDTEVRVRK